MKTGWKIFFGAAAILGVGSLFSNNEKNITPIKKSNTRKKFNFNSILFLGDSNTAYPWTYGHQFTENFTELLNIHILAKIGAKTDWMLTNLKTELEKNKYDVICVLGGSNDIYAENKIDNAKINLDTVYRLAKSKGSKVIAISPASHDYFNKRTERKLQLQDELMDWIAKNPNKDFYIDFKSFTNNKKYFSSKDGYLHAQKEAHTILLNKLTDILYTI